MGRSEFCFAEAIKILPKVSQQFLDRDDQLCQLSLSGSKVASAISCALQAGVSASHCLSLLEHGRGITQGFGINCRSDLTDLHGRHPSIFEKYNSLRIEIDSPLVNRLTTQIENSSVTNQANSDQSTYEARRWRRILVIYEANEVLTYIRKLVGFEGFQRPPSTDELIVMATEGPIVIFNSTYCRSDAIIMADSIIRTLPLPKMVHSEVVERIGQPTRLVRGKRSSYLARNTEMKLILLWLWDVAVELVFEELQFNGSIPDDSNLPRVWWIGIGHWL